MTEPDPLVSAPPSPVKPNALVRLPFQGGFIEAVRDKHGQGWLAVKPACETMGLNFSGQRQRLMRQGWATVCMMPTVGADGKNRKMFVLDRACVPMWLSTLDAERIKDPAVRAAVELWQRDATAVLGRAFDGAGRQVVTRIVRATEDRDI